MIRSAVLLVMVLGATPGFATAGDAPPRPAPAEIDLLVSQLADRDFRVRERATARLLELGPFALRALRDVDSTEVEVRFRARRITRRIVGTVPRIVNAFEREVADVEEEATRRLAARRRRAAESLEPIQDALTRARSLDSALAVRKQRAVLTESVSVSTSFPVAATAIVEALQSELVAAKQEATERIAERKRDLVASLTRHEVQLERRGREEAARVVGNTIKSVKEGASDIREDPGRVSEMDPTVGRTYFVKVTGVASGSVWGSEVYTTDSAIGLAAVHAGVLRVGESGVVKITVVPGRGAYTGSTRHGVSTSSWGGYPLSYRISLASALLDATTVPTAPGLPDVAKLLADYREDIGKLKEAFERRSGKLKRIAAGRLAPFQDAFAAQGKLGEALAVRGTRLEYLGHRITPFPVEPPDEAKRVVEAVEKDTTEIESWAVARIGQQRREVLSRLGRWHEDFATAGEATLAEGVKTVIGALENGYVTAKPDPGTVQQLNSQPGRSHYLKVTGAKSGSVWGSDVYTTDSTIAVAAVHAGILQVGQTAVVKVTLLPGQNAYAGSSRNGVTTSAWGAYPTSFRIQRVFADPKLKPR